MLRAAGVLKGAAPNKDDWEMHHTGAVWGELDQCGGRINLDGLMVGDTVYMGAEADEAKQEVAKMKWWAGQGQKVLQAYQQAITAMNSGRMMHKDELVGKVLAQIYTARYARRLECMTKWLYGVRRC